VSPEDDDGADEAEIPLTMTASVVLTNLPKDARSALRDAGRERDEERKGKHHVSTPMPISFFLEDKQLSQVST
jgi:hypothetical protein